jgi:hypothetical protein
MGAALQAIGSFAAAAFAWVILEFIGRPIRKFFDLRGEVIRRLAQVANIPARWKELPDYPPGAVERLELSETDIKKLEEAQVILQDLAAQLRAFALNETFALRIVRALRYSPLEASSGLFGLSNSFDTYGKDKAAHRRLVVRALRISDEA